MANTTFNERMDYINKLAEARGYDQKQIDFLRDCAEWASAHRWREIRKGLDKWVDVSVYADPAFNTNQMSEIREGLERGVDVTIYAHPKFASHQMGEIRLGLEHGVDVTLYADERYGESRMREIRLGLEAKIDVTPYLNPDYDSSTMSACRRAIMDGLDVASFADASLNWRVMRAIRAQVEDDPSFVNDLTRTMKDGFTAAQAYEIVLGTKQGIDVSVFADPSVSRATMGIIRSSLVDGEGIDKYLDKGFNARQLAVICYGLHYDLDVSTFADPSVDAREMREICDKLEKAREEAESERAFEELLNMIFEH